MLALATFLTAASWPAQAQTADDYVAQGRTALAAHDLVTANARFAQAVNLSPNHQTANALYGVTRVLVVFQQPVGSNFLTRLGFPTAGRSLYDWTSMPPKDTNAVPFAPAGVNANEAVAVLRTNVLPQITAAAANLAKVTDPAFLLSLSAAETSTIAVDVDYGDLMLMRAMLHGMEFLGYTLNRYNFDAQLTGLRSLYSQDQFTLQRVLRDYPQLLSSISTSDLGAAQTAFVAAVNRYQDASTLIRSRPAGQTRLFNYDAGMDSGEQNFRQTLRDLKLSLNGIVPASADPSLDLHLSSFFAPGWTFRSFLPEFIGNSVVLGTLPDPTFGGLLIGRTAEEITALGKGKVTYVSRFGRTRGEGFDFAGHQLFLPFWGQSGYAYLIQLSEDLATWYDWGVVPGVDGPVQFADPTVAGTAQRFYRAIEYPIWQVRDYIAPPPNDYFYNAEPILELGTTYIGHNINATTETGEYSSATAWWLWTAPASGSYRLSLEGSAACEYARIYTGNRLTNLTWVASGNQTFHANAGTTYRIAVSSYCGGGGIRLKMLALPALVVTSNPANGATLLPPATLSIQAAATDASGIRRMWVSTNGVLAALASSNRLNATFSGLGVGSPGEWFQVQVTALAQAGVEMTTNLQFRIPPPNDNFSQRIPLTGVSTEAFGNPKTATREPGEPSHGDPYYGSIWWSWTAPSSGQTTIEVWYEDCPYCYPPVVAAYTGSSVSGLSIIASNNLSDRYPSMTFNAVAGTQYQIAGAGWGLMGLSILRDNLPLVSVTTPTNNQRFVTATGTTTNVTINAAATDTDGTVSQVWIYGDGRLLGQFTTPPYSVVWNNVSVGTHTVSVSAQDNMGGTGQAQSAFYFGPPTYNIQTLAGLVGVAGSADGTNGAARFNNPYGIGLDSLGNVYVADTGNQTVRKITTAGVVSTLAGSAGAGYGWTADGTGNAARFAAPYGLATDGANNLYVADGQTIRKITPTGVVTTLAGLAGFSGSADGMGSSARFNNPYGVAVDGSNNVYVADGYNQTIRKVTPGGAVSTLAGLAGYLGSADGVGSAARFNYPSGVAVDASGHVYVADCYNQTIRKITPGGVVSTLAGWAGYSGVVDGTGSSARFYYPWGMAVDGANNVYVAEPWSDTIRKITPAGVVTTLAGSAYWSGSFDGFGSEARFYNPHGVTVDASGRIVVTDSSNHTIRIGILQ